MADNCIFSTRISYVLVLASTEVYLSYDQYMFIYVHMLSVPYCVKSFTFSHLYAGL